MTDSYHIDMIQYGTTFVTPVGSLVGQVNSILITFNLSDTNGSCRARPWRARLTNLDINMYIAQSQMLVRKLTLYYIVYAKTNKTIYGVMQSIYAKKKYGKEVWKKKTNCEIK